MTRTITVVGSFNVDLVVHGPVLPRPGETVTGGTFSALPGGKGANQAAAAAAMGARVRFVGCVGDDEHGRLARRVLAAAGIDVSGLRTVDRQFISLAKQSNKTRTRRNRLEKLIREAGMPHRPRVVPESEAETRPTPRSPMDIPDSELPRA